MSGTQELYQSQTAAIQRTGAGCRTWAQRSRGIAVIFTLLVCVGLFSLRTAYRQTEAMADSHPGFDSAAVTGTPTVDERYGYATLEIQEGYVVSLCGVPANDGQNVEFYLTNDASSTIWLRGEVLDSDGNLLASTGVLRPGEYLTTISLDQPLTEDETAVTLRIVAYEPETWQSRGNVSLQTTIYRGFQ